MSQVVTDEIVGVARNAGIAFFEDNPVDGEFDLGIYRAALEAILPLIDPAGGGEGKAVVKPLEWGPLSKVVNELWGKPDVRQSIGRHPSFGRYGGSYTVQEMEPNGKWGWWNTWTSDREPEGVEDDEVSAKAACQADYADRILSALTLPPASDSEKLIEAAYRQGIEDAAKLCDVMAKTKAMSGPKSTIIASAMSHAGEDLASSIRALERTSNG